MAAPNPQAVERQMYVDMKLGGVDDPSYTLAQLRDMTGGGVNANKAAQASVDLYMLRQEIINTAGEINDGTAAALVADDNSATTAALNTRLGIVNIGDVPLLKKATASNSFSTNISPHNIIGPAAAQYTVFGGTSLFPHAIGNSSLSFFAGYDNKNWDNSIASHNTGHHSINGGVQGHPTITGGSMGVNFGGYGFIGGGTDVRVFGNHGVAVGGFQNSAGANVITKLTTAIVPGDTSIVVESPTGIVIGHFMFIGAGTPALDTAYGDGPLERAVVTSIVGNVVSLDTFTNVQGVQADGTSTAVAFANAHPVNTKVFFATAGGASSAAVGGGNNNHATGPGSVIPGGLRNTTSGLYSAAVGADNDARGQSTFVSGQGGKAIHSGQRTLANFYFSSPGDSQTSERVTRQTTTTAVVTTMPVLQTIPAGTVCAWQAVLVAKDTATSDVSVWKLEGVFKYTGVGNVINVGAPTITLMAQDAAAVAWTVTLLNGSGTLNFRVTGEAAKTIRWVTRFEFTEVI